MERQARHDADRAGDLQFVDNPYAVGGVKFGYNFATGRQQAAAIPTTAISKTAEIAQGQGHRGKRGGVFKKPYTKKNSFSYNRYNRYQGEAQAGK